MKKKIKERLLLFKIIDLNITERAWGVQGDEGWKYPRYYSYYDYKFRRYKRGIFVTINSFTLRVFLYQSICGIMTGCLKRPYQKHFL